MPGVIGTTGDARSPLRATCCRSARPRAWRERSRVLPYCRPTRHELDTQEGYHHRLTTPTFPHVANIAWVASAAACTGTPDPCGRGWLRRLPARARPRPLHEPDGRGRVGALHGQEHMDRNRRSE